jgi:hypothetical protein
MDNPRDNVVYLSKRSPTDAEAPKQEEEAQEVHDVEMDVADVDSPTEEVFVDDDRVIIRTHFGGGMAMTPLAAKELAVRLIEAACFVERD